MKKLLSWLAIGLLFLNVELDAQVTTFQDYYQWNNLPNIDHGPYNKVKTWMNGTIPVYFAVGGATTPSGAADVATISRIEANGTMTWTKFLFAPAGSVKTFEAVSVAITDDWTDPVIAVLCNQVDLQEVSTAYLYKFDQNGALLASVDLGPGKAVDVIWNATFPWEEFDVLCETDGVNGHDFELTGVEYFGFTPVWSTVYNYAKGDTPTCMVIDNGNIVAGGYTEVGTDRQILIVKVQPYGGAIWGQPFGMANRRETVTDIVFYRNAQQALRYGFCGYDETTNQALVGDVSVLGPQLGFSERYLTSVDEKVRWSRATAMARTDNSIFVSGICDDGQTFITTFVKDANITPIDFWFYDDGEDIPEELRDIHWNFKGLVQNQPRVVAVGYQKRNGTWGTSPAGQNYSWIMTVELNGDANCPTQATAVFSHLTSESSQPGVTASPGAYVGNFTQFANPTFFASLDNCVSRARLAAEEGDAPVAGESSNGISALYPNPGNGMFYLETALGETETAVLRITDLSGRVVHEQQLPTGTLRQTIDLSALADGMYNWSVTINGAPVRSERLILTR